jgi:signal transduction histidine kinase/ligand-binding sensor domain-containing protein/DNA-binding response OmpR family regulator
VRSHSKTGLLGTKGLILLVLFSACLSWGGHAQKSNPSFSTFSTANGLSQNDVRSIFQDQDGFIWVGTYGGLNRFDGYEFKIYTHEIGKATSLSSNLIGDIDQDESGNIWVATDDQGINMLDIDTEQFLSIRNQPGFPDQIISNHVLCIEIDKDQNVWAGSESGINLIKYNQETKKVTVRQFRDIQQATPRINDIYEDRHQNIWLGTPTGLTRCIKSGNDQYEFIKYGFNELIRSFNENDTALLIQTNRHLYALPFDQASNSNPKVYEIGENFVAYNIAISQDGKIWGTTHSGLNIIDKSSKASVSKIDQGLSSIYCESIFRDRTGMIWIGTNGGGLNLYNPYQKSFTQFYDQPAYQPLLANKIRAIKEDSDQNIWVGVEGSGLFMIDTKSGFLPSKTFKVNEVDNLVYAIEEVHIGGKKQLWAGTSLPSRVAIIDLNTYHQTEIEPVDDIKVETEGAVFSILQDSEKQVWLGTYNKGLYRFNFNEKGQVNHQSHFTFQDWDGTSISSNIVRSIIEDDAGNLWIGTDKGVNKISEDEKAVENPNFIKYQHRPNDETSLSYDYVLPIHASRDGTIWIGTMGGGLNKLIKGTSSGNDHFERIGVKDGLQDNTVKSIEEDVHGNLWLGTNRGLTKLNPKSMEVISYGLNDGVQDLEFGEIASTTRSNGEMLFGGVKGFNLFHPDQIVPDTTTPAIGFTEFRVLNKTVQPGELINDRVLLSAALNKTSEIALKHIESSFSILFSSLHYAAPEQNEYQYLLEGFDESWITVPASNRIARYTNLSPGAYTFRIRASNSNGYWSSQSRSINIIIHPPFWQTPYAIVLYIFLFLVGLWFFRKYTLISYSLKNQFQLEHLEKEKLEEVSQLKLKFFTNISHEFRTPLTLILGLTEKLKSNAANGPEKDSYYSKIHRNAHVLLNLVNQLLDFRKVEQGKMAVKVSKGNIGEYIKSLCDNFIDLANRKQIDFQYEQEETIHGYLDRDILERIMFNLLSNAFKFTDESGEIHVMLEKENDHLHLEVRDSGIGMSQEVRDNLFERFSHTFIKREHGSGIGLSYTKGLIDLYQGTIEFSSVEGVGTTFVVKLPYLGHQFDNLVENLSDQAPEEKRQKEVDWILDESNGSNHDHGKAELHDHTVLIVEDNEDILFYLNEHFKSKYNIVQAKNGRQALEICLKQDIQIVISDIMMPEMDGLEFCEKLKSDDRINHIPIILLTAKRSQDSKLEGYEKGADAYISKPFNIEELDTRLATLLASRQKLLEKLQTKMDLSPSEIQVTSLDERFLKKVMGYIEENISLSELTIEMIAREVGMSQLHLNKKLKVLVGQTANAFVRNIRLKRAAQLLSKNQYAVNEVMYEVGFMDAKYFRSCFKKEFGTTPSEYQKEKV